MPLPCSSRAHHFEVRQPALVAGVSAPEPDCLALGPIKQLTNLLGIRLPHTCLLPPVVWLVWGPQWDVVTIVSSLGLPWYWQ